MDECEANILVVDDDPINIQIIEDYLEDESYQIQSCMSGEAALEFLSNTEHGIDIVLLDRMMPGMDGLDVLSAMKNHSHLQYIPVIIQSARARKSEILEGVKAGAFYYLTKPFEEEELLSIVRTATKDSLQFREVQTLLAETYKSFSLLSSGSFEFKTVKDAVALAGLLARNYPNPQKVVTGLRELLLNAVEHGNLAITYDEKTTLNAEFKLHEEITRRMELPEYKDKNVFVELVSTETEITITISDQGKGFNWKEYMEVSPERVMDNHGRGIVMANLMSFDSVTYEGCGNRVIAVVNV